MACFSFSFGPFFLDLSVGIEGSSGDILEVLLLRAIIRVGAGLDLLAELLKDLLDPGGLLQVLPVGPLEDLDVLGLVGLRQEDVGEMMRVDDLGHIFFLSLMLLRRLIDGHHLCVLRLLMVDPLGLVGALRLLLLECHLGCEDGHILHLVGGLALIVVRRCLDF